MPDVSDNTVWSQVDASNTQPSPNGAPENMLPSGVNDTMRMMMGAIKRLQVRLGPTLTAGGTADALTLTYTPAPTAYVQGDIYSFIVASANTGAATLNVNGLGAKDIFKHSAVVGIAALVANDLLPGAAVTVAYDGTQFQIMGGFPG